MDNQYLWKNLLQQDFDDPTLAWQRFREGVDILPLYGDLAQGCSCALLRYQPGAQVPRHMHVGVEFLWLLRGSQRDERGQYQAGTFLINPASSSHAIVSDTGCVVLAVWEKPVAFT